MAGVIDSTGLPILVLGDEESLAHALVSRLELFGHGAEYIQYTSDAEISASLEPDRWRAVVILTRDDVLSLRLSLLSAHVRPELPVWTTMFDATVTRELHHAVPTVNVLSPADLVAEELAAQCLAAGAQPVGRLRSGVRFVDDALRLVVGAGLGLIAASTTMC
jgi:hypothetical protein